MVKFSDEDKVERSNSSYFGEGVHEIQIDSVDAGTTDKGSEYFEFSLLGANGETGKARVYFTDAAKGYSFNTIRSIFVHNTPEKKKDEIRKTIDAVEDTDKLLELCQALRGKQCWLLVQKTGEKYQSKSNNKWYDQMNFNIYGYMPSYTPSEASKNVTSVKEDMGGGEEITSDPNADPDEPFPFGG